MIEILPRVLWMFCPPGLRAGHVTESCELIHVIFKCLTCCLGGQLTKFCVCVWRLVQVSVSYDWSGQTGVWGEQSTRDHQCSRETPAAAGRRTHTLDRTGVCVWERESVWLLLLCMCLSLHLLPARIKSHALTSEDIHTNMQPKNHFRAQVSVVYVGGF